MHKLVLKNQRYQQVVADILEDVKGVKKMALILQPNQVMLFKKDLYKYVIILDLVLLILISVILTKIYFIRSSLKHNQIQQMRIQQGLPLQKIKASIPILKGRVELYSHGSIDLLSNRMPINFFLTIEYPISMLRKTQTPSVRINNGKIISSKLIYKTIINKTVYEKRDYDGEVDLYYRQNLFPLDTQVIPIQIVTEREYENYLLNIDEYEIDLNNIPKNFHDYTLLKTALVSNVKEHNIRVYVGGKKYYKNYYVSENLVYMLYSHHNLSTYLKNMQYLLLSLLMSIFALLINARKNNPTTGRISAISGSSFALAANLFHVSTLTKPSGGISLLDMVSGYVAVVILICFLVTVRSVRLNDTRGYKCSKFHDLIMFKHISYWTCLFFVSIYVLLVYITG